MVVFAGRLVERQAGRAVVVVGRDAGRLAGGAPAPVAEAEVALQAVLVAEEAHAAGQGQRIGQVERDLAEHRAITVLAVLHGQPDRSRKPGDRLLRREPVDLVVLVDRMLLHLPEQAGHEAQPMLVRRGDAQLVAGLLVTIGRLDELRRIDRAATGRAGEGVGVEVGTDVGAVPGEGVVPEGIVAVVGFRIDIALEMGKGIGQVEIADLALHRQRRLGPAVVGGFGIEVHQFQVAHGRVVTGAAVGLLVLAHDLRGDGPVVVEVDAQRGARAVGVGLVVIVLGQRLVVGGDAGRRIGAGAADVVDIAGVVFFPAHQAHRSALADRDIDHAIDHVADAAA